jgi:hypothetical protein
LSDKAGIVRPAELGAAERHSSQLGSRRAAVPAGSDPLGLLRLQATAGNRAVVRLLSSGQPIGYRSIQRTPEKKRAGPAPQGTVVKDAIVGWSQSDVLVRVTREVGGTQGYDDRLQAIAVARLAKAEPAAAVQDDGKKWHAVEITADFEGGPARTSRAAMDAPAAEDTPFLSVYGLPSLAGIEPARKQADALKLTLAELEARKPAGGPARKVVEAEMDQLRSDLEKANLELARSILGVHESDLYFSRSLSGRVAGEINIIGQPEKGSPGGGHAPIGGETGFEEGRASAVAIDFPELSAPRAAETMFHEVSHLKDWELAQHWVKKYRAETKRLFVKEALSPFKEWLDNQAKKGRLTKADVEMVMMEAGDASAYTEARANVRSFLADLQAGAPELATKALVGYANALKARSKGGQYGNPAAGSEVEASLIAELKAAYGQMPDKMKGQYRAAVAAARAANPDAWISALDFSKPKGR